MPVSSEQQTHSKKINTHSLSLTLSYTYTHTTESLSHSHSLSLSLSLSYTPADTHSHTQHTLSLDAIFPATACIMSVLKVYIHVHIYKSHKKLKRVMSTAMSIRPFLLHKHECLFTQVGKTTRFLVTLLRELSP